MDTFRYWLGVLLIMGIPPGLGWWFLIHPFVGFWRRLGARVTMALMAVFFIVGAGGLFTVRGRLMGQDLGTSWPRAAAGLALLGAGACVSARRRAYLTTRILVGVPEVRKEADQRGKLLDRGPYAILRHPRYAELVLFTWGYAAMANYVGPYVLAGLTLPAIHLVVLLEERELRDRFGDAYGEYCGRVPRYIPRWRR